MKRTECPIDNPVVEEIRAIRRRVWELSDGTVQGYLDTLHRLAEERTKNGETKASKSRTARRTGKTRASTKRIAKRRSTRANGRKKV